MRSVSVRARSAALLLLLVLFIAVPAIADDPPPAPTDPPQARIHVPIGVTSQDEEPPSAWDLFLIWLEHRIHVPVG